MLDQGANIHGTVKRMNWAPLTFDRNKNKFPFKPMDIEKQGYKDSYYMDVEWKGKTARHKLTCNAYRSGTGTSVSLATSSCHPRTHWDLIPAGTKANWYFDRSLSQRYRNMKALESRSLEGSDPDEECTDKILSEMEPRTCGQGSADWFLDRQFAGTSSTIAEVAMAVAPLVSKVDDIYDAFETVLAYAGCNEILGSIVDATPPSNSDSESKSDEDDDDNPDKKQAKEWIKSLTNDEVDVDEEF